MTATDEGTEAGTSNRGMGGGRDEKYALLEDIALFTLKHKGQ